jgi:hypothetical protein
MLIRSNAEMIAEVELAGIKPNWEDPSSLFSDRPLITQCPRAFDFESSLGLNSSITPVRSMTEKAGQSSVFHGTD